MLRTLVAAIVSGGNLKNEETIRINGASSDSGVLSAAESATDSVGPRQTSAFIGCGHWERYHYPLSGWGKLEDFNYANQSFSGQTGRLYAEILRRQQGRAAVLFEGIGSASTLTGTISAGGSTVIQTAGTSAVTTQGWAQFDFLGTTDSVGGFAVFTNGNGNGNRRRYLLNQA